MSSKVHKPFVNGLLNAGLFMASLFTNVSLEKTINICVNELLKSNSRIHGLNKKQITEMLSLIT